MRVPWAACESPASSATLMTAATCCFIVTAGASSHSLVLSSAHEHWALSPPHCFDELFMVSTHEGSSRAVRHRLASRSTPSATRWQCTVTQGCLSAWAEVSVWQACFCTARPTDATEFSRSWSPLLAVPGLRGGYSGAPPRRCVSPRKGACPHREPGVLLLLRSPPNWRALCSPQNGSQKEMCFPLAFKVKRSRIYAESKSYLYQ